MPWLSLDYCLSFTRRLLRYYPIIIVVLPNYYRGNTRREQCYPSINVVLPDYYGGITRRLWRYYPTITVVLPDCNLDITQLLRDIAELCRYR